MNWYNMTKTSSQYDAFQGIKTIDGILVAMIWEGWKKTIEVYTQKQIEQKLNNIIKQLRSGITDPSLMMKLQYDVRQYAQALRQIKKHQLET